MSAPKRSSVACLRCRPSRRLIRIRPVGCREYLRRCSDLSAVLREGGTPSKLPLVHRRADESRDRLVHRRGTRHSLPPRAALCRNSEVNTGAGSFLILLEIQQLQQGTNDDVRLPRSVRYSAFAFDLYVEIRNRCRWNRVVDSEITRSNQATNDYRLTVIPYRDVSRCLNDQDTILKNFHNLSGEVQAHIRAQRRLPFAIQAHLRIGVEEILKAARDAVCADDS